MTTTATIRHGVPLPRLCTSGTVFCLATGPSLTQADVDAIRGHGTVIAVNDAHKLAPWADVLYSSDRYWWKHYRCVPTFAGVRASIEFSPGRYAKELAALSPEMFFLRQTGHQGVETDPSGIRTCGQNSGGAAVNLAVHQFAMTEGPRRIILLGYDCGVPGGKRHFFGDHPPTLQQHVSLFPTWRAAFAAMREPMDALGIEVINCSRSTSISAFRCAPLEEVLA
jgi:hypothetical protein